MKLLLVEDTDSHARLVQRYIEHFEGAAVEVVHERTLAGGLRALRDGSFDAIMLDLSLPDSAWESTLSVVVETAPRTPTVVLTSVGDLELAAHAVAQGADDYVVKGSMNAEMLQRALRYAIERKKVLEKLRRRTEELEQSNEALKHFAHTTAHELRQPLNSSSLNLGLIKVFLDRGESGIPLATESVDRVSVALRDMSDTMNDLLAFASLEKADKQRVDCDLGALLQDVLDDLAPQIQESGAKITASQLPHAPCNQRHVRHVFGNLISNALKYRSDRPLEVQIDGEDDGDAWKVTVKDNGVGMETDECESVFEMFKRLPSQAHIQGNGVGLALCRSIIEHHGGRISAHSKPGVGSSFVFTLPKMAM